MDLTLMNRDRILEAIDQLRHRKARPDIQRICSYLFRRFHVNSAEAKKDLDWCVANNYVLKVEYKGSISYRNAAKKLAHMKHRAEFHHIFAPQFQNAVGAVALNNTVNNNNQNNVNNKVGKNFGELLTNVIGELIINEPDYLEYGVPPAEIINSILLKDSVRYTKNYIIILLAKEVEKRNLIKMENGHYLMGPPKHEEKEKDNMRPVVEYRKEREVIKKSETQTEVNKAENEVTEVKEKENKQIKKQPTPKANVVGENKEKPQKIEKTQNMEVISDEKKQDSENLRVGGRRKKAKKVFDPSDSHVPKKRGRPAGSLNRSTIERQLSKQSDELQVQPRPDSRMSNGSREQGGVCSVCHLQNKKGPNDRLVSCRECSNKAHFGCLNNREDMMLKMYPDNTWQCPHCKTCVVCYETSDAGSLIVCSVCADGYHANCHQPKITEKVKNGQKWLCVNCQMPDELKINEIQSSIEQTYPAKDDSTPEKERRDSHVSSNTSNSHSGGSGRSSPSYESLASSPPPPQLSPQIGDRCESQSLRESPGPDSDSQSNKDSDEEDVKLVDEVKCKVEEEVKCKEEEKMKCKEMEEIKCKEMEEIKCKGKEEIKCKVKEDIKCKEEEVKCKEEEEEEYPNIDPSIPDATHWTIDEVYQYFAQYFPEEAKIFKEQEIDGRSLLLLKRMDVLTNLNLKLGPALKIYKHVIRLQVRRDDRSLYYL